MDDQWPQYYSYPSKNYTYGEGTSFVRLWEPKPYDDHLRQIVERIWESTCGSYIYGDTNYRNWFNAEKRWQPSYASVYDGVARRYREMHDE